MPRPPAFPGLRSQVTVAITGIALAAVLLFAVPLAVLAGRLFEAQALTELQGQAARATATIPDDAIAGRRPVRLPPAAAGTELGVYDAAGRRVAGAGPDRIAAGTALRKGPDGADLAVVLPVPSDTATAGSVRASLPLRAVHLRLLRACGLLAGLGALVVLVALLLARTAARKIARPFEELTIAARGLGTGHYDIDLPGWGITEADAAGQALRTSATQIDAMVRHQKDFVRHASHQLRNPLAALVIHLEQQPPAVGAALGRAFHLLTTIEDLVELRATSATDAAHCDPRAVAQEAVLRYSADCPAVPVVLRTDPEAGPVAVAEPALRQSLDVLLDNACRHGRGPVTVTVEPHGDAVIIEVSDEGPGFAADAIPGTGLDLARNLAERAGGALIVRRRAPRPRVALLLPADHPVSQVSAYGSVSQR